MEITYEEFKQAVEEQIEGANAIIEVANTKAKNIAEKMIKSEYIMRDEDGNYVLNDMLIKLDLMNYRIEQQIYKTGVQLRKSYNRNGTLTTDVNYKHLSETIAQATKKLTFKEAFLQYAALRQSYDFTNKAEQIAKVHPLVVEAYNKLGTDKVKSLRYVKSAIQKELADIDITKSQDEKVSALIHKAVTYPNTYTCPELQQIIAAAYYIAGISTKVKASHITKWYNCKKTSERIGGVPTTVYKIFNPKLL